MIYDVVIIGWWASGLFCSIFLPKELKKCIIEKTDKLGSKVLLSGWERCNLTNIHLDPDFHYVGQSLKSLPSLFHRFWPEDMIEYLTTHALDVQEEANGRVLLKSWKAKQLVEFLVDESQKNDTELLLSHEVLSIQQSYTNQQSHSEWNEESSKITISFDYAQDDRTIQQSYTNHQSHTNQQGHSEWNEESSAHDILRLRSGWQVRDDKTIWQSHTNQQSHSEWNEESSAHDIPAYRRQASRCSEWQVSDDKNNSTFVVTTSAWVYLAKKVIVATGGMTYPQIGASTFAYDIAQQLTLSVWHHHPALCGIETEEDLSSLAGNTVLTTITISSHVTPIYTATGPLLFTHRGLSWPLIFDSTLYIDQPHHTLITCSFDLAATSRRVIQTLHLHPGDTERTFHVKALRSLQEAKVTVWGILLENLDQSFQSKKIPWLYFIGESLDITGKTWGYNLQWAWTSAYVCATTLIKHER